MPEAEWLRPRRCIQPRACLGQFPVEQETQSPKQDKPKVKHSKTHIIKLTKVKLKEQILKVAREKQQITHKGIPIRITADISIETLQARRE